MIPPRPGAASQLAVVFEQQPLLLNEVRQVAIAAGNYDQTGALDFASMLERIGSTVLIEIAITLLVQEYMQRAFAVSEDRRYWRYTLACAISCQEIALPGDDNHLVAYVAGLLHDIGRLALMAAYPGRYANILSLADRMFCENPSFNLLEHERMLYGLDHFATGSWLAATWGLPPWLRAITGKFDRAAAGEYRELVATIRSGTGLAHSLGFGYLQTAPRAEIKEILGRLPAAWEHWQTLDHWKHAEEYMRGKIQSRLSLYQATKPESD